MGYLEVKKPDKLKLKARIVLSFIVMFNTKYLFDWTQINWIGNAKQIRARHDQTLV